MADVHPGSPTGAVQKTAENRWLMVLLSDNFGAVSKFLGMCLISGQRTALTADAKQQTDARKLEQMT